MNKGGRYIAQKGSKKPKLVERTETPPPGVRRKPETEPNPTAETPPAKPEKE